MHKIFTLKQLGDNSREESVYLGFTDLGKPYDRVNTNSEIVQHGWQTLK